MLCVVLLFSQTHNIRNFSHTISFIFTIIIKRFFEARNKNALWCESVAKLESENKELKSEIERLKKENEMMDDLRPEYDLSKLVRVPLEKSLRMKHSLNSNVFSNLTKKQWEEYAGKILVIDPATDKILLSVESEDLIDEEKIVGLQIIIEGNIPWASGISSSSAFCVCSAMVSHYANRTKQITKE